MQDTTESVQQTTAATSAIPSVDPQQMEQLIQQLKQEQNLALGAIAGFIAMALGAALWATITVIANYQIGYMAIGIGVLVGFANRYFGKGIEAIYGYIGAGFSLIGCLIGNLLTVCVFAAKEASVPLSQVILHLTPSIVVELFKAMFQPMDLLFYGLAIYAGYHYSIRKITQAELEKIQKTQS